MWFKDDDHINEKSIVSVEDSLLITNDSTSITMALYNGFVSVVHPKTTQWHHYTFARKNNKPFIFIDGIDMSNTNTQTQITPSSVQSTYVFDIALNENTRYTVSGLDSYFNTYISKESFIDDQVYIQAQVGDKLTFNVTTTSGHPFIIKMSNTNPTRDGTDNEKLDTVVYSGDYDTGKGLISGTAVWDTTNETVGTYYGICVNHSSMFFVINLNPKPVTSDTSDVKSLYIGKSASNSSSIADLRVYNEFNNYTIERLSQLATDKYFQVGANHISDIAPSTLSQFKMNPTVSKYDNTTPKDVSYNLVSKSVGTGTPVEEKEPFERVSGHIAPYAYEWYLEDESQVKNINPHININNPDKIFKSLFNGFEISVVYWKYVETASETSDVNVYSSIRSDILNVVSSSDGFMELSFNITSDNKVITTKTSTPFVLNKWYLVAVNAGFNDGHISLSLGLYDNQYNGNSDSYIGTSMIHPIDAGVFYDTSLNTVNTDIKVGEGLTKYADVRVYNKFITSPDIYRIIHTSVQPRVEKYNYNVIRYSTSPSTNDWNSDKYQPISYSGTITDGTRNGSTVKVFEYTGSVQNWNVPSGVNNITAYVWGAGGGGIGYYHRSSDTAYNGGAGGFVKVDIDTTNITSFKVIVGEGGSSTSDISTTDYIVPRTFGGGGHANLPGQSYRTGSGGGLSGIFVATDFTISNGNIGTNSVPYVVVGGGGGGSVSINGYNLSGGGGGGGTTFTNGRNGSDASATSNYEGHGGKGGTGGAGGDSTFDGEAGSKYYGGNSAKFASGGGSGYYGGGGGAAGGDNSGGGGGGSSYWGHSQVTYIVDVGGTNGASTGPVIDNSYITSVNDVIVAGTGKGGSETNPKAGDGLVIITYTKPETSIKIFNSPITTSLETLEKFYKLQLTLSYWKYLESSDNVLTDFSVFSQDNDNYINHVIVGYNSENKLTLSIRNVSQTYTTTHPVSFDTYTWYNYTISIDYDGNKLTNDIYISTDSDTIYHHNNETNTFVPFLGLNIPNNMRLGLHPQDTTTVVKQKLENFKLYSAKISKQTLRNVLHNDNDNNHLLNEDMSDLEIWYRLQDFKDGVFTNTITDSSVNSHHGTGNSIKMTSTLNALDNRNVYSLLTSNYMSTTISNPTGKISSPLIVDGPSNNKTFAIKIKIDDMDDGVFYNIISYKGMTISVSSLLIKITIDGSDTEHSVAIPTDLPVSNMWRSLVVTYDHDTQVTCVIYNGEHLGCSDHNVSISEDNDTIKILHNTGISASNYSVSVEDFRYYTTIIDQERIYKYCKGNTTM